MFSALPDDPARFTSWTWQQIEPYYSELEARDLNAGNVAAWLSDWSGLTDRVNESYSRLYVATTVNTADAQAASRFQQFLDTIYPASQAAEQRLKEKLLQSGLSVPGMEIPIRNMRAESEIFSEANLPLISEEQKLGTVYDKIVGARTVTWEGKEVTPRQLAPVLEGPDRDARERAWRLIADRHLADREALNALWVQLLETRKKIAANAGFKSYTEYRWKQMHRFDYTPEDCKRFHASIEQVVVPAAERVYERGRRRLGVDRLRPWDIASAGWGNVVAPPDVPRLHPFNTVDELEEGCNAIFARVDPQFARYFTTMRQEGLLDLLNRKNKAPGAYSLPYEASHRPFIFANSVGTPDDISTVLHEGGHAFHTFETVNLPYFQQRAENAVPMEFAEVASMGMEFLASPYLAAPEAHFFSEAESARARTQHIETALTFWPYMAVVDAFQLWVYENMNDAMDPANCDAQWQSLWNRFMKGVDWGGLEEVSSTRWHRQLHIFTLPLYYVEYGMAQLGAVQVWGNALHDQAKAVADYRRALALGGVVSLPELFSAAGVRFGFDSEILGRAISLMERVLEELEAVVG